MTIRLFSKVAAALLLAGASIAAMAQDYPTKPVRIVVTYPPGGGADVMARLIAAKLTTSMGQSFIVENRPGASGQIGAVNVMQSAPDGYTLMVDASSFAVNPSLYPKLPYDPKKAFVPITLLALFPNVLVVNPSFPANSVKDLVTMAKSQPGMVNYASSGNGSAQHLAAELFKQQAGIDMQHIPYKGGGPAMGDVIAGQVPVFFANTASSMGHIKSGKLKPIAATGSKRAQNMPNLPTIAESGVPGYEVYEWNVLFAPAGTPPAIVNKLYMEVAKVLAMKDVRDRIGTLGGEIAAKNPRDTEQFLNEQFVKWEKVVRKGNITVD
jgi:tripartite-type tricarboxylate transporter receptor subunit TctC